MTTKLSYIVYVSRASFLFKPTDLITLLNKAKEDNLRLGVTGLLLYRDQSFIQMIEGDEHVIDALFERISADKRHCYVKLLEKDTISERIFSDWSMGFKNISGLQHDLPDGFLPFFDASLKLESIGYNDNRIWDYFLYFRQAS